jgi:hypothetical protein
VAPHLPLRLALGALALLPLYRLAHQSFWFDELFTVWVARQPFADAYRHAAQDGFTPPLYYWLIGALWRFGLRDEALRLLSAGFGAACLAGIFRLAGRLPGRRGRIGALAFAGLSPLLVSLSQELRPYTAFLAASVWALERFLAWRERPSSALACVWGGLVVLAIAFSYLALALLPLAFVAASAEKQRRRQALVACAAVAAVGLLISAPGLAKGRMLAAERLARGRVALAGGAAPFARVLLGPGVRHGPLADARDRRLASAAEWTGRAALALGALLAWRTRTRALVAAAGTLGFAVAAVYAADAVIGIGVTTRYLSLAFLPLTALFALALHNVPRAGAALLAVATLLQLAGLANYLFDRGYAREDWRGLMARVREERAPGQTVLGFPGHHALVAATLYAPELAIAGGFAGRAGEPVYLYRDGARFDGYFFEGRLERVDPDIARTLASRFGGPLLLVSYADHDWHGDLRPILDALGRDRLFATEVFAGREKLLLRRFSALP